MHTRGGIYNETVKKVASDYYLYARSTEIIEKRYDLRSLYNAPPHSFYELGALPIFALKQCLLLKFIYETFKVKNAKPIAYTHIIGNLKLKTIIGVLKAFGFEFVTVSELLA